MGRARIRKRAFIKMSFGKNFEERSLAYLWQTNDAGLHGIGSLTLRIGERISNY
jgi:hypothetical protein